MPGPRLPSFAPCALAGLALVVACAQPRPVDPLAPRAMRTVARWTVERQGAALGSVSLLEIEDPIEPIRIYRARNQAGQWLGFVDAHGGVFQRQPFDEAEVFLGIYPMADGLALLYEVPSAVELVPADPVDGQPAEASFQFPPREDR